MATNKNAYIRYKAIDKCLRNPGRKYTISDLLEACNDALSEFDASTGGIAKRQLYDDINFMKSMDGFEAPIDTYKDGRYSIYYYTDPNYSINNQPINETEMNQINEALLVLKRFEGLPQFDWIYELAPKITQSFDMKDEYQSEIISFEENIFLKGREFIGTLFNAITYKRVLLISYQSFRVNKSDEIKFHPYFLKQYNNRWFVFGKTQGYDSITTMALDRIEHIKEINEKYIPNNAVEFNEFFEDVIGVTITNDKVEKIEIKVSNNLAPYIETKPIHGSQKVVSRSDDELILSIEVIPNYELYTLLLSYGDGLEVTSPITVRDELKLRIEKMLSNYTNAQPPHK